MAPTSILTARYNELVGSRRIMDDGVQRQVLARLQALYDTLSATQKQPVSGIAKLFKKTEMRAPAKNLYIWGQVGRGKSMLMDLFFEEAPVARKKRVHFHAFMQEIYGRIHQLRQDNQLSKSGADPVLVLAHQIAEETALLCFDELQATDVADATLLYRLFEALFATGITIVSTSNHPPSSLYTGGVQRERFNKFIALIEERMEIVSLTSEQDYRYAQKTASQDMYVYPLGPKADAFIEAAIARLAANTHPQQGMLTVQGRGLPFLLYDQRIGRFTFQDLCETALGPADYLAIAKRLDTLILTGIPKLAPEKRNEAKRFVTLIDALYEHKVKLLSTAEVKAAEIYCEGDGSFEFARTVSRLKEMQSAKWVNT